MKRKTIPHGLSYHPLYRVWQSMRLRCLDPNHRAYPSYGGRGIGMCERWQNSLAHFIEDMGEKPSPKHEIDRINNDGGYEPGNCRWVTRSENDRNRRNTKWVIYKGERRKFADLCDQHQIAMDLAAWRLRNGWSVEMAFEKPTRHKRKSA